MTITIDLQISLKLASTGKRADIRHFYQIPGPKTLSQWVNATLQDYVSTGEICLRIIDETESAQLNGSYRHKPYPTNILSFPYSSEAHDPNPLLGDLAICAPIVKKEAAKYGIPLKNHWAHIIIHGCLHVAGFDHQTEKEAIKMENLEKRLLQQFAAFA